MISGWMVFQVLELSVHRKSLIDESNCFAQGGHQGEKKWRPSLLSLIARFGFFSKGFDHFDYILYIEVFSVPLRKTAANYYTQKSIRHTKLLLF